MLTKIIETAEEMMKLGAGIAQKVVPPFCIHLTGQIGAGKTTYARGFLRAMGINEPVKSPTFSILEEYYIADKDIFHSDLYRLENQNDFEMLGVEINENSKGILFIEWPEKISNFNFGEEFFLKLSLSGQNRSIELQTNNKKFLNCINRININNPI